ncbi:MAG: bifunctional biotin--[acetyl-CoA-carboxylase] ligase/biotin operon repressor BirA [Gammaproteobacteria bacterium]|nr:bifunctional biotin--[acetyl-CoA-carboxylase] ligase/biotin operon repressor BirA [Gammaproteobacteria bacterium]
MSVRFEILDLLADGRFLSGEALGQKLGVSRAAIWKQLQLIRQLGVEIHAVSGKGYRLASPLELLDEVIIRSHLTPQTLDYLAHIDIHHEIDSTNALLRIKAVEGADSGMVCLAEFQHQGKGRRGRQWVSPFAQNIYSSLLWRLDEGLSALAGISLVIGVAVLRTLHCAGIKIAGLKWPNDILADGRKLAGILLESAGESNGPCYIVIGVGINVRMPAIAGGDIDQPWIDMEGLVEHKVSRNYLTATLINQLIQALQEFKVSGMSGFIQEWREHDVLINKKVEFVVHNEVLMGKVVGIDEQGALLMMVGDELRRFVSGEISPRICV